MGWEAARPISVEPVSERERRTHTRFLETFLNPNGRKQRRNGSQPGADNPGIIWEAQLNLEYPAPASARVDWGQSVRNVCAEIEFEPANELTAAADLLLECVDSDGNSEVLARKQGAIKPEWHNGRARQQVDLGAWQIIRGKASHSQQIACSEPGEYKLRATVARGETRLKSASRSLYVQTEPPPPPAKRPVTLSAKAVNNSDGEKKRVDHGETLLIHVFARNRAVEAGKFLFNAFLEDETLERKSPIELDATPAGDAPRPQTLLLERLQLLDPNKNAPLPLDGIRQLRMPESVGKYQLKAKLFAEDGERVAYSSDIFYFQQDPSRKQNDLPFEIKPDHSGKQIEMWKMNADLTELIYAADYPLRQELRDVQRQRRPLQGKNAFIAEVSAHGLLEWAMRPLEGNNDEGNFQQLLDESGDETDPLRERYVRKLEQLSRELKESATEFGQTRRETVAIMLEIFNLEAS